MGRLSVAARMAAALVLLLVPACGGDPEVQPDGPAGPAISAETRAQVDEVLAHLNNTSETERWREQLIEVGQRDDAHRTFVIDQCRRRLEEARQKGGTGPGILRSAGRRRAMEAIGRLGDTPEGRKLLRSGLEDDIEVRVAAAAGLASWGDATVLPTLLDAVFQLPEGDPLRQRALEGLRRLATPERRPLILNHITGAGHHEVLQPIVLAAFPTDPAERSAALRDVVENHPNPFARALVLQVLVELRDPATLELARKGLAGGDPVMRPVALAALGAVGGAEAAREMEQVLLADPDDAEAVVRGLYRVGRLEALRAAAAAVGKRQLRPRTRETVVRGFFLEMARPEAPAAYRTPQARELAADALRPVLAEPQGPVLVAAIEALGRVGDPETDVEPLLDLLRTPTPEVARAVIVALGRLGGSYAATRLVELVARDATQREQAALALAGFAEPRDVPMDVLISLLDDRDPAVRRAAFAALRGLAKSEDGLGYNPEGNESQRAAPIQRWRDWWTARRGG